MTSAKNIARAYQACFDFHEGQFHGDGLTVAQHLVSTCKAGLAMGQEQRGTDGKIDEAALLIAVGRRQVYDEIYALLTMETS